MKIINKIKEWVRGKQLPPRKVFHEGKQIIIERHTRIQPPLVKFINNIYTAILLFINREWRWLIPTTIALAALLITFFTKK